MSIIQITDKIRVRRLDNDNVVVDRLGDEVKMHLRKDQSDTDPRWQTVSYHTSYGDAAVSVFKDFEPKNGDLKSFVEQFQAFRREVRELLGVPLPEKKTIPLGKPS